MQEPGTGAPARLDGAAAQAPAIRASDRERDAATLRLQEAFAEGRLDDSEFDQRMRTALLARTRPELDRLLADLPEPRPARLEEVRPITAVAGWVLPSGTAGRSI
jgi:Domain of unknown function (DUF1707)